MKLAILLTLLVSNVCNAAPYDDALTLLHSNKQSEALEIFKSIPNHSKAQFMVGNIYLHQKKFDIALDSLAKPAHIGLPDAMLATALVFKKRGNKELHSQWAVKAMKKGSVLAKYFVMKIMLDEAKPGAQAFQIRLQFRQFCIYEIPLIEKYKFGLADARKGCYRYIKNTPIERLAKLGDSRAKLVLAIADEKNGDPIAAFNKIKSLSEQGNESATNKLASMYIHGTGTDIDVEKGIDLYKITDTGLSFLRIGEYYYSISRDKEAVKWFVKSIEKGFIKANYKLAYMFAKGLGVKQDIDKARALILEANPKLQPNSIEFKVIPRG